MSSIVCNNYKRTRNLALTICLQHKGLSVSRHVLGPVLLPVQVDLNKRDEKTIF